MGLVIHTSEAQREAERLAAPMRADRRLFLTADRDRIVEDGDPDAAVLFAPVGEPILSAQIVRYGLTESDGKVVLPGGAVETAEAAAAPEPGPSTDGDGGEGSPQ